MKKGILISIAVILLAAVAGGIYAWPKYFGQKACTLEAKICPDGSSVGRTGPNCEFAPCPGEDKKSNFQNKSLEEAIVRFLLTQTIFSWKTTENSQNFCSIENLRPGQELFPIYIWAYCAEYTMENGQIKTQSGTSVPAKIDYPNELSFYDIGRFRHEIPRDGSLNDDDIKTIFPEDAQKMISSLNKQTIIKRNELAAANNISAWEAIKQAVSDCRVKKAFQNHQREVNVELKNGQEINAVEPVIDDIMKIIQAANDKCGQITIATE